MERLKAQDRKMDHIERLKRCEEIPLLKAAFEEGKMKKEERTARTRNRLVEMKGDKEAVFDSQKSFRCVNFTMSILSKMKVQPFQSLWSSTILFPPNTVVLHFVSL